MSKKFASIPEAIRDIRNGRLVIVVDDPDRENEGDLVCAASKATSDTINFMAKHGRGLICLPMTGKRLDELRIAPMVENNQEVRDAAFTVSVDARRRITTGVSAADRARTIQVLIDPKSRPDDLTRPGHIFPLRYREGGVLVRAGHTEAAVDLAKLAGLSSGGRVFGNIKQKGAMARGPEAQRRSAPNKFKNVRRITLI